jgi:D-xylose transport system ATP-binding protein
MHGSRDHRLSMAIDSNGGARSADRASTVPTESSDAAASSTGTPLLRLSKIGKNFGAVQALANIDLEIYPGEVVALVGDNGAGKSTMIKTISGIWSPDAGEIFWEGQQVHIRSPRAASELGIATMYQDLALADNLDITQNMFLGREIRRFGFLVDGEMERKARETLASLSVRTVSSVRQLVSSLSGGQRQTVAIAKAVLWNSKVVFLDEPTAALGVAQTRQVLDLVRRLADQGLGVVLISHNMNDVMEVADRVAALFLGRIAAEVFTKDSNTTQIVELITAGRSGDIGLAPATADESI